MQSERDLFGLRNFVEIGTGEVRDGSKLILEGGREVFWHEDLNVPSIIPRLQGLRRLVFPTMIPFVEKDSVATKDGGFVVIKIFALPLHGLAAFDVDVELVYIGRIAIQKEHHSFEESSRIQRIVRQFQSK